MSGGAQVIRKFAIGSACALASWSSAEACSPSNEVMTGEQHYGVLSKNRYSDIKRENSSVALVYANEIRRKKLKDPKDNYDRPGKKKFVKVELEVIEILYGDYEAVEAKWLPPLDDTHMLEELEYKNQDKSFDFWDRMDLTTATAEGYGGVTSCGPEPTATLAPNNYYLHFKSGQRDLAFEIVSNKDAQLVKDFKEVFKDSSYSKLRRNPKNYFKHMRGYIEVVVTQCPKLNDYMLSGFFDESPTYEYDGRKSFSEISKYHSNIHDLRVIDFYSYLNRLDDDASKCVVGDRYLIIDRVSKKVERGNFGGFSITQPQHRFLKIQSGGINPKNIISNIDVVSDETISALQIKSWIREANTP